MSAKIKKNIALLSMTATTGLLLPWAVADARKPEEAEPARPPAAHAAPNRGGAAAEERAAQAEERNAQMGEARAQQEQAKQQHEQAMQQAAQARQQQEQSLREQEQQGRKAQQEAQRAQQEQARAQQEQARGQQQPHEQPQEHAAMLEHGPGGPGGQPGGAEHMGRSAAFAKDRAGNPVFGRAATPPQLSAARLPLQKAIAMPVLAPGASAADQAHLAEVQNNLQQHMYAVAAAEAPSNFHSMPNLAQQAYFNNYQTMIGNQQLIINRQNTFMNAVEQSQWPFWYQPQPGWQFVNGFTLGNAIVADLNWLRWGWHPYYGPQPEGFVCANNYVPTPWIYMPAYGTWRQPGVNSYASFGPPYDYTGPISVEMFEPRRVSVDVPFGGLLPQRVVNAVYFYNAYYYPEFGRYGYMNRHNNWIWLNLGTQAF